MSYGGWRDQVVHRVGTVPYQWKVRDGSGCIRCGVYADIAAKRGICHDVCGDCEAQIVVAPTLEPPTPPRTLADLSMLLRWLGLRAKVTEDQARGRIVIRVAAETARLLSLWLAPMQIVGVVYLIVPDLRWYECRLRRVQVFGGSSSGGC